MPNLDVTGHRWVGALAFFQFMLEYQKGVDNGAADALSWVPICHNQETIKLLLEGAVMGTANCGKAEASEALLSEHEQLGREAQIQAVRLALMHMVNWSEAQEADPILATCRKWMHTRKDTPLHKRDALLRKYLNDAVEMDYGCMLFCMQNSLVMSKGLLYISTTLKGEREGVLAFVVPAAQCHTALNGVHHDAGHQGQQRTLALTQECFW